MSRPSSDDADRADQNAKAELFAAAAEQADRYIRHERNGRVFPDSDALEVLEDLKAWSLDAPRPPGDVIEDLARLGEAAAVRSTGGRYFGFVTGGTEQTALAASLLGLAWDQNGALPAMSPLAAALDATAARWVVELLGLPTESVAAFCGGASVANLIAVVAARDSLLARQGWSVAESGLRGSPPISVVTSREAHSSVLKALRIAGWGSNELHIIDTDDYGRMRVDALADIAAPVLVVAQMGNVNTGYCDPIADLAAWAAESYAPSEYWLHIDGAFGLWAAASTSQRHHAVGVDLAHSWATDAHKWLNTPYDNGIVIARNGLDLRAAMSATAAYLPGHGGQANQQWSDELREPMHMGLQMSQATRSIPVLAELAVLGTVGVAELIDRCCEHVSDLSRLLADGGVEVPVPPGLNQVLVRFGSDETTGAVVGKVQDDGICWAGSTTWQGQRAMRLSVCDASTTTEDIEASADSILAAWRSLR